VRLGRRDSSLSSNFFFSSYTEDTLSPLVACFARIIGLVFPRLPIHRGPAVRGGAWREVTACDVGLPRKRPLFAVFGSPNSRRCGLRRACAPSASMLFRKRSKSYRGRRSFLVFADGRHSGAASTLAASPRGADGTGAVPVRHDRHAPPWSAESGISINCGTRQRGNGRARTHSS